MKINNAWPTAAKLRNFAARDKDVAGKKVRAPTFVEARAVAQTFRELHLLP